MLKDPKHPMTPGYITNDVSQHILRMYLSPTFCLSSHLELNPQLLRDVNVDPINLGNSALDIFFLFLF